MTRRRGLNREAVVAAASAYVDADGADALTLTNLAERLDVKPPSLYNHVNGLDALRRDVALGAIHDLADRLSEASMGRAGVDALTAVARAFRAYASEHPGLYEMTAVARPGDTEFAAASLRAVEPVLAVLRAYDLDDRQAVNAARTLRSALHGFVSLENIGGFGLDVDIDESFDWLVATLSASLTAADRS